MVSFLVMMFLCLDNYLEITSIEKKVTEDSVRGGGAGVDNSPIRNFGICLVNTIATHSKKKIPKLATRKNIILTTVSAENFRNLALFSIDAIPNSGTQGLYRVYTGFVQGLYYTEFIQSV